MSSLRRGGGVRRPHHWEWWRRAPGMILIAVAGALIGLGVHGVPTTPTPKASTAANGPGAR